MINQQDEPVAWALTVDQLAEAHEHLGDLVQQIKSDPSYDETTYAVDLGHVMAHLNRAWASRNVARELTEQEWEDLREYPSDLRPIA